MPTHEIVYRKQYTSGNEIGINYTSTDSQTSGAENNISESLTDAADTQVAYALDISQAKTFAIWCTGVNMTVDTNSTSTPGDTFSLTAGVPIIWSTGQVPSATIPLSADVTTLYVTCSGTGVLNVRSLYDPTA